MVDWKPEHLPRLARGWLRELRGEEPEEDYDFGGGVTMLYFTARPEMKWAFLEAVMAIAETDDELCTIAAGPLEYVLGQHGEDYIGRVEEWSVADPKFARMTTGAWQYQMSDEVWRRLQAVQAKAVADTGVDS